MSTFRVLCITIFGLGLLSCNKKDPEVKSVSTPSSNLSFYFQGKVNGQDLSDTTRYVNSSLDTFTVTKFNYFISNIKLTREDGFIYKEKESYHLIKHMEGKTAFTSRGLPPGTYNKIDFIIGVDSIRNISGAQTGDLDVGNDMYWDWNQGYLFFKLEGHFSSYERPLGQDYGLHIGGGNGPNACIQYCNLVLPEPLIVKSGGTSKLVFNTQVDEIFDHPLKMGFDYYYDNVKYGDKIMRTVSQNYKDMFMISKIEN